MGCFLCKLFGGKKNKAGGKKDSSYDWEDNKQENDNEGNDDGAGDDGDDGGDD